MARAPRNIRSSGAVEQFYRVVLSSSPIEWLCSHLAGSIDPMGLRNQPDIGEPLVATPKMVE